MAKPTQAHMSQTWSKRRTQAFKDQKKDQMKYYMGAKLIEVGVNPKSAIYRWKVEISGDDETWTCSAYWGESKDKILQEESGKIT